VLSEADLVVSAADLQNGPDSVVLQAGQLVLDAVGYGAFLPDNVFAGEGFPAPDAPPGSSITRNEQASDTNNNAFDFFIEVSPTPGESALPVNELPSASLLCPLTSLTGELLEFDASGSADPDGVLETWRFAWGDGSTDSILQTPTTLHAFPPGGSYTVTVTVTDNEGGQASASCSVTVPPLPFGAAKSVKAGRGLTCAVDAADQIWCWGGNILDSLGQGGDYNTLSRWPLPVRPKGLQADVVDYFVGAEHACTLHEHDRVYCWGGSWNWVPSVLVSASTNAPVTGVSSLEDGIFNGWGRLNNGTYVVFGSNANGQCGIPFNGGFISKATVPSIGGAGTAPAVTVRRQSGGAFSCGLNTSGELWCWGYDTGSDDFGWNAKKISVGSQTVKNFAPANQHFCIILGDGSVRCGGNNKSGQLGSGNYTKSGDFAAVPVIGLPLAAEKVFANGANSCARLVDGSMWCWGANDYGQLGTGEGALALPSSPVPLPVDVMPEGTVEFAMGENHVCTFTVDSEIWCWGRNFNGELGDGTYIDRLFPVKVIWDNWTVVP
jgi:alpha-tubulin suppressor-like RCC1 family protein